MMKMLLVMTFCFFYLHVIHAQGTLWNTRQLKIIDSLKTKLANSQADTNRIKILIALSLSNVQMNQRAEKYTREGLALAEKYGREALALALKLDIKEFKSPTLRRLSMAL